MEQLNALLKLNNASLSDKSHGNEATALQRQDITKFLSNYYHEFSKLTRHLLDVESHHRRKNFSGSFTPITSRDNQLLSLLLKQKMIFKSAKSDQRYHFSHDRDYIRYLTGGWLEELVWLAITEAGIDYASYSQMVEWHTTNYQGYNEIDIIGRHETRLFFISCKTILPHLQRRSKLNKLRKYLHEADDLSDHFGKKGDKVILVTTADLIKDHQDLGLNSNRYPQVTGKAEVLDVDILGLEMLPFDDMIKYFKEILL